MPVQATCSECNKRIQAPDKFAGRSVKCPNCQTQVTFPSLTADGKRPIPSTRPLPSRLVACTQCGTEHRLLRAEAQQVRCRDCRTLFPGAEGPLYPFGAVPPLATSSPASVEAASPAEVPTAEQPPAADVVESPALSPIADSQIAAATSGAPVVTATPAGSPEQSSAATDASVAAGLTALTQASVVGPVESAPVAEVTIPAGQSGPVTPIEISVGPSSTSQIGPPTQAAPVMPEGPDVTGSEAPVPIQVGPPASSGGVPIEINTGDSPPVIATGGAQAGAMGGGASGAYKPVLRQLGPKKSMVGRAVEKALKPRGCRVKASVRCKIGPDKSFRQRIHQLGIFPEQSDIQVDDMMVLTIGDRAGDFRMIMPFDKGVACPVEFVSVMSGHLPTSVGLLRGRGQNWGLAVSNSKPGSLLPQQVQSLMSAFGGQADAIWAVLDPNEPQTAAESLQQDRSLQADLRFDSKVKLGPMEVTYNINWIAQAMPLGPEQYLLVAKFIPRNRMMAMNFGAEWFVQWRDKFHRAAQQLPPGQGNFACFDYGFIWGAVAQEMMDLQLL